MSYSLNSYRRLIEQGLAGGYTFAPFDLARSAGAKRLYLRHDVDYSLEIALDLARVNAEFEVQGTFFVLLRSQIYNLLSPRSLELAQQISDLGQYIGLHASLPSAFSRVGGDGIIAALRADFDVMQQNLPMLSSVFSWHNTCPGLLEWSRKLPQVAGLVNVYAAQFIEEISYFSDSNMRYSAEELVGIVRTGQHAAIHLLCHPLNWVVGGSIMRNILAGTWPYVIRERELGFMTNQVYQELLPDGMPESILQNFAVKWNRAAAVRARD